MPSNPSVRSLRALDSVNFFLADVRDGVGPYLAIYLLATHHWHPSDIGLAMSVSGIAGVVAQTPAGALVDRLRAKRWLAAIAAAFVAAGCLLMVLKTTLTSVITGQIMVGVAAAVVGPGVAAITLGLVGRRRLDRRVGRNEAWNHGGNVVAAALAGLLGHYVGREYIFYLVAVMAVLSIVSVFFVREAEIDHAVARGADGPAASEEPTPDTAATPAVSGLTALLADKRVLVFSLAAVLFHFANAAMLPLVGQRLSEGHSTGASLYMSACIIVAQLVMIGSTSWAGRAASKRGRKPVLLLAFLLLPVRGVLYTLWDNPYYLVSVQVLDGIAGGIFGVVILLVVADLTKGTGRFNLVQGALGTATGLGAALSTLAAGYVVQYLGYNAAFLGLAAIAGMALVVFWLLVPETGDAPAEAPPVVPVPVLP
ncbi:MFS transporter [Hymenobacter sp. BT186]|uniref:MFS transporter n=1 Tax=Hymenobacter telluris TaxID=2816474 RepID=A0A939EVZ3_9BACT|nr:MFS transporter [Hymenobacter telluris]MBO0358443.1 MFS transporter [Hymenobacter telluris]MBW3374469.1 MFS transporter [Hymenobacter norwichensis]